MLTLFEHLTPQWVPPTRSRLSETLLNSQYAAVKAEIDKIIAEEQHPNIQFNESKNSAHNRILNISVGTARGAFYYTNLDMRAATLSASTMMIKIEEECTKISQAQLNRINSISRDTYGTNLAIFR